MINNDNNEIALSLNYLIYYLVSRENLLIKNMLKEEARGTKLVHGCTS